MQHCIYFLRHPSTNEIRYVGKTNNPKRRLIQHIHTAKYKLKKSHCCYWISSILKTNKTPIMQVINWFNLEKDCNNSEKIIIDNFRKNGINLTNLTDGGEGQCGRVMSEETKNKISQTKLKNGNPLKGVPRDISVKLKISDAKKGRKLSLEHRKKLSEAKIGRKIPIQTRIKMSIAGKTRASIPKIREELISRLEAYKMSQA